MWMQLKYTSLKATIGEECKDTSWLFVTHAVVSIFTLIHQEKRSHGGHTGLDSVSKAWASLRVSNLVNDILKARISDYPVVTQVMNQHLHVNSVTRAEFTIHLATLSALSNRVETSKKDLDSLTQKVNQLKKKWSEPAPVPLVTTSAGGTVNSADTGTGVLDVLVAEKVEFLLSKGKTKIGICSVTAPVWTWYVGSLGDIRWVYSPTDIPGRLVEILAGFKLDSNTVKKWR